MATCPTCRTKYPDSVEVCTADGARLLPDAAFVGADADLKPGDVVGEYRVEVKLGEGGFGTVYRAQHPVIGKKAAIKVLAREFSSKPEMVARFIDEARAVNQIRNKGIIDIFAFGAMPDGRQYFIMELLEGMVLDAFIKQKGRIGIADALPILRGVARAVDAAHQANIAHRDLKPDNVFLVADEDGAVHTKLLDFGIAKLVGEQSGRTRTGAPIGTPSYMSPEQARGQQVDLRTDIYSFGSMAYEMLTGSTPFEGASIMDILLKQVSEMPVAPSKRCDAVPAALDAPILHMLEKDAERRPRTLMAAVEELAAAAGLAPDSRAPVSLDPSLHVGTARTIQATPNPRTLVGSTTEVAQSPPAKKKFRPWMVAPPLVLVAFAFFFGFRGGEHKARREAKLAISQTVAPTAPSASQAPLDDMIDVLIEAVPIAEVYEGDRKLGTTPFSTKWLKQPGNKHLTLKAAGYVAQELDVDTSRGGNFHEQLEKAAVKAHTTVTKPTGTRMSTDLEQPSL